MNSLLFSPEGQLPKNFVGRKGELATINAWFESNSAFCFILGIGGIGKSELIRQFCNEKSKKGYKIIWCSLRDIPILEDLISTILINYSLENYSTSSPEENLIKFLVKNESFLILDNFDVILNSNGEFLSGYERYGEFMANLSMNETNTIITSRVTPIFEKVIDKKKYKTLILKGITNRHSVQILNQSGKLIANKVDLTSLADSLSGNPLILKLVEHLIVDLYDAKVSLFIDSGHLFKTDISNLMEELVNKLSLNQQIIIFRLATSREPLTVKEIFDGCVTSNSLQLPIQDLIVLKNRFLIESSNGRFYLQHLVQELCILKLTRLIVESLSKNALGFLSNFPLCDADRPRHVRIAQTRDTISKIIDLLSDYFGGTIRIKEILFKVFDLCKINAMGYGSFGAANIFNILYLGNFDHEHLDLSNCVLRNLDLSESNLNNINAINAEFKNCKFLSSHEYVFSIKLLYDGRYAIIGNMNGAISLMELPSGRIQKVYDWEVIWLRSIAISSQDLVAATDDRGRLKIIDLRSESSIQYPGNGRQIRSIAFAKNDKIIIAGGEDGLIRILSSLDSDEKIKYIDVGCEIWSLCANKNIIAVSGQNFSLRVWYLNTLKEKKINEIIDDISGRVVQITRDGALAFVGCDDGKIRIYCLKTFSLHCSLKIHDGPIWAMEIIEENTSFWIYSGGHDGAIKIWNFILPKKLVLKANIIENDGPVWPLTVDAKRNFLATVTKNNKIRIWDAKSFEQLEILSGNSNKILVVAASNEKSIIASGGQDGNVLLWNALNNKFIKKLTGHNGSVRALVFNKTGNLLASAGEDWDIRIWDVSSQKLRAVLEGSNNWIWSLDFNLKSSFLIGCGADTFLHTWNLENHEKHYKLTGHKARIISCWYDNGVDIVFTVSMDGEIRKWDISNLDNYSTECIYKLKEVPLSAVKISDRLLAIGSRIGELMIFDLIDRKIVDRAFNAHENGIHSLKYDSSKDLLFSAGENGLIQSWKVSNFRHHKISNVKEGYPISSLAIYSCQELLFYASCEPKIGVGNLSSLEILDAITIPRQYEGFNITNSRGINNDQKNILKHFGAIEDKKLW